MPHTPTLTGQARDVLTEQEATERAARVPEARYDINLDIVAGRATYRGDVVVRFTSRGEGSTFLDFRGRSIDLLEINGTPVEPDWNGYRLTLPGWLVSRRHDPPYRVRERLRHDRRRLPSLRGSRGWRGVRLHELRAVRGPPPVPVLRSARHQGPLHGRGDSAGGMAGCRQRPAGRNERRLPTNALPDALPRRSSSALT